MKARRYAHGELKRLASEIKVGDGIVTDVKTAESLRVSFGYIGARMARRTLPDGRCEIWRVNSVK